MKRQLLLIPLLLYFMGELKAQTFEISGGASSSHLYNLVYTWYAAPRTQRMATHIPASQLAAGGLVSGATITSLELEVLAGNTIALPAGANVKIYLENRPSTSLDLGTGAMAWDVSAATAVFDGDPSSILGSSGGWKVFSFGTGGTSSSFVYTGGAIVVHSDYIHTTAIGGSSALPMLYANDVQGTPLPNNWTTNSTKYTNNSTTTPPASMSSSTANHPHLRLNFTTGPCQSPPTAGNATATNATPCLGSNFILNLSGNTTGSGQTYQWESGPSASGPWTPEGGAQISASLSVTANTTGTTYYRCQVTCGTTVPSAPVAVTVPAAMQGNYTINKNAPASATNFQSITTALNTLKCATMAGSVTLTVTAGSGPYNEQMIIDSIPGISAANTLTIDGSGDTITYATTVSTAGTRPTVKLNGADYTTVKNFVIVAGGSTYGWGVHVANGSSYDSIVNCTINVASTNTTQSYSGGVIASGSETSVTTDGLFNNIAIVNNTIHGGYQGIILTGDATTPAANNYVVGNTILNSYSEGLSLTENNSPVISGNDISRPTLTTSAATFTGIELGGGVYNAKINGNKIHGTHTATTSQSGGVYGIHLTSCDAPTGQENIISNNLIYDMNNQGGTQAGLRNAGSDGAYYYHNTVVLDNAASTAGTTYAFYQTTAASNISIKNNLLYITRGGSGTKHLLYFNTATSAIVSDNNILFINAPSGTNYLGRTGGNDYANLTAWQGNSYDLGSYDFDPGFNPTAPNPYEPTSALSDNLGVYVNINDDINGAARNAATPDIGAYEFYIPVCQPSSMNPGTVVLSNPNPCTGVAVTLDLLNNSTGLTQTYTWEEATVPNGPYTAVSAALSAAPFTHTPATTAYYRCAVTCNTTTVYSDTVLITVQPLFPANTYTINAAAPTGGTNFQTFADAATAMKCGIAGPVVFNVSPGNYTNDHFWLDTIANVSATNTITINGHGATLNHAASGTGDRSTVRLNNTSYVTIDSLNIIASGSTYGWGVNIMNNADNNVISNCTVTVDTTSSSSNYMGIAVSGTATSYSTASDCDRIVLKNNTINGGYHGISIYGSATAKSATDSILNNKIKNYYSYGVMLLQNISSVVEANEMSRPTRTNSTTASGVTLSTGNEGVHVSRNTIHNLFDGMTSSTSACYPLYTTGADASSSNPNIISNNLVYNINNRDGTIYGIYNTSSDYCNYYHNTIVLDDPTVTTSETTYGFHQSTAASTLDIKNNIFYVQRSGTGANYGIYMNTAATTFTADGNDYFVGGAASNNLGYLDGAGDQVALSNWQNAATQDFVSYEVNPVFANPTANDYVPQAVALDNTAVPTGIMVDITNAPRSASTPDIGAYEYTSPVCQSPPTPGTITGAPVSICAGAAINVSLIGNSAGIGQTYTWETSPNPATTAFTAVTGANSASNYTANPGATAYYRVAVTCGTSTVYSDTVLINVYQPLAGAYTVDKGLPTSGTNFNSFKDAMAALACGISGPVTLNVTPGSGPYNERIVFPAGIATNTTDTIAIHGNGEALVYSATVSAERSAILMDSVKYVTIDSLSIDVSGGTYGWGINLMRQSSYNRIQNCTITTAKGSSTDYFPIVMNGSQTSYSTGGVNNYNIITGNKIIGGYYGIVSYGGSSSVSTGNTYSYNTIQDQYSYSIYNYYGSGVTVSSNDISKPTATSVSTAAGVYLTNSGAGNIIDKNRIHNLFDGAVTSTSAAYPIYLASTDGTASQPNVISNNLIYNINNGEGTIYGIYTTGSDYGNFYHNTIVLDDQTVTTNETTRGIYQTTAATNFDFKNNIIVVTRSGTGTNYGIYLNAATSWTADNNDYFVSGAAAAHVGYATSSQTTLANWQTATGQDALSFDVDPIFTNAGTGDYTPGNFVIDNQGTPVSITTDILDAPRNASTPDIGAYEFNVPTCTGTPVAGTASADDTAGCVGQTINLSLTGYTLGQGISIQWEESLSPGVWTAISGATTATYADTFTAPVLYRAAVRCNNGTPSYSDTVTLAQNPFFMCYCSPYTGDSLHTTNGNNITNVQITTTPLNNSTTSAGTGGYTRTDYKVSTNTAALTQAVNYSAFVTVSNANYTVHGWIDYNQDGIFTPAEYVPFTTSGTLASGTINVPVTALPGLTGMRLRVATNATTYGDTSACYNVSTGRETEDYVVDIITNQPCTGTPSTAGTATVDEDTLCVTGHVFLSATGFPVNLGVDINWQSSPAGQNNFVDIAGANKDTFTVSGLTASTDFRLRATCNNPGGGAAYSNTLNVVVNNPAIVNTIPGFRCGTGTVALFAEADAGQVVNWYSAPTGGTAIGTGNLFVTPSISATTPYYAAASTTGGGLATAGLTNATSTTGYTLEAGLFFNALADFNLEGVYVYPNGTGAGTATIELQDGNVSPATTLQTITVNLTGSGTPHVKTYVPLNFNVPAGTGYKLMMTTRTGGVSGLIRESGAGWGSYPITTPGIVTVTNGNCCSGNTTSTSYYYFYDWKVSTGCEGPRVQVDATVNTGSTTGLAAGGTVVSNVQADGTTMNYDAPCSDKVVTITDAAGGNVMGGTNAIVVTPPSVQTYSGAPFVPRFYDITPSSNGPATVTVYALQTEFDAYNTWVNNNSSALPLLPANATDPNVSNIVITQYHGSASDGTTGPGGLYDITNGVTYIPNSAITVTPPGTGSNYWTMQFPVTGFSGFFIHSGNGPLDIRLASIQASNHGAKNRVDWMIASAKEGTFTLERSHNARDFEAISNIPVKGNQRSYTYWDYQPLMGINYYRLKMIEADGTFTYSDVVNAVVSDKAAFTVSAYPNPASEKITFTVTGAQGAHPEVIVTDIAGKFISKAEMKGNQETISLSGLASGVYLIKYTDDAHSETIRITKE